MNAGDRNIIDNLRRKYGYRIGNISDGELLRRFEDYQLSVKNRDLRFGDGPVTELDWLAGDIDSPQAQP